MKASLIKISFVSAGGEIILLVKQEQTRIASNSIGTRGANGRIYFIAYDVYCIGLHISLDVLPF